MNTIVETINAAGRGFVDLALPMLIQSGVLILILLIVDVILRRKVRAVFRYWIWMLVLVKLVLPPSLGSPVSIGTWFGATLEAPAASLFESEPPQASAPAATTELSPVVSALLTPPDPWIAQPPELPAVVTPAPTAPVEMKPPMIPETSVTVRPPGVSLSWQGLALLVWSAVAFSLTLLLVQRAYFVRGLIGQASQANRTLVEELEDCRRRVGLRRAVGLRLSPNATSPAVCGLFRPVILIPQNLAPRLHGHDLEAVLLHELAHVRRGDLWVNLAQTLLQIVYFYNPLVWLANAMIRRTREQAVDETVLVSMGETARQYPETLVNIARLAFTRRPALSLRLIGVVESRSALTGRIKHMLGRPLPKTARLGLLGLVIVFVIAAVLLPMAKADRRPETFHAEGGPLDLQLVGVCADGDDELYDPNGTRLDQRLGVVDASQMSWGQKRQRRDFVFALPGDHGQFLPAEAHIIGPAGERHALGFSATPLWLYPREGPQLLVVSTATLPRTHEVGLLRRREVPIDKVDLTLHYYYGPPRDCVCTFTGPFVPGKPGRADGNSGYELTFAPLPYSADSGELRFHISPPRGFDGDTTALLYDTDGRRYPPTSPWTLDRGQRQLFYRYQGVPLDRIKTITMGEKPHATTFRNVVIDSPARPARDYPAYLDVMAERLGRKDLSSRQLAMYRFQSSEEAIAVLDVLQDRGLIESAVQSLRPGARTLDLATLDPQVLERVHTAATRWSQGPDLRIRACGIQLGLLGRWPEFFDQAMQMLASDYAHLAPADRKDLGQDLARVVLTLLQGYRSRLSPDQFQRLADFQAGQRDLPILPPPRESQFKTTLPNGATVELLGVCPFPRKAGSWWRPDGAPLADAPYDRIDQFIATPDKAGSPFEVALRVRNLPEGCTTTVQSPGTNYLTSDNVAHKAGQPQKDLRWVIVEAMPNQATCTIRCYVIEPWKVLARSGPQTSASEDTPDAEAVFSGIREDPGRMVTIGVTGRVVDPNQHRFSAEGATQRIVVVKKNGEIEETPLGNFYAYDTPDSVVATFPRLSLDEVREFQFQVRTITYAQFENVPLRPSLETDVRVSVSSKDAGIMPAGMVGTWLFENPEGDDEQMAVFPDGRVVVLYANGHKDETRYDRGFITLGEYNNARVRMVLDANGTILHYFGGPDTEIYGKRWRRIAPEPQTDLLAPLTGPAGQQTDAVVEPATDASIREVVLPEADGRTVPVILDLATGELVPMPAAGPEPAKMQQALREMGKGDIVYDVDLGDRNIFLLRDATSEQAQEETGDPDEPGIKGHHIGQNLPETLVVTTRERRQYQVMILAADAKACTLRYSPLPLDQGPGGGALVEPGAAPATKADDSSDAAAKLPNGVTLKLLGYSQLTAQGLTWWTAQGEETTVPGVYAADVDGLGTTLAFEMDPPESEVYDVRLLRGPDEERPKRVWRLPNSRIWLIALGEPRNFVNVELTTQIAETPEVQLIPLTAEDRGKVVAVNKFGLAQIVDLQVVAPKTKTSEEGTETPPTIQFTSIQTPDSYPAIVALWDTEGLTHPITKTVRNARAVRYEASLWPDRLTAVVIEAAPAQRSNATFRNVPLSFGHTATVQVQADSQSRTVWRRGLGSLMIESLVNALNQYQNDQGGRLPSSLEAMRAYLHDDNFNWLTQHMTYVAQGGLPPEDPGSVPVAYDRTLLPQGQGTDVIWANRHGAYVQFESPRRLAELGIAAPNTAALSPAPAVKPPDLPPQPAEAVKLPNGLTVELLAYSRLGQAGLEWWTPKGERTTIPGVYEADVEGHGSVLALRVEPAPEAGVSAWFFQPPDVRYELKPVWRVNGSDIWLVPLGEGRSYVNLELQIKVKDPVTAGAVTLEQLSAPGASATDNRGIQGISDVKPVGSDSVAFTVHGAWPRPEIVAALDARGQVHPLRRVSTGGPEQYVGDPQGPPPRFEVDVPADRLAGLVVVGYSERAGSMKIRNLSLRPGQPTEVRVEVVPEQQGPWWHHDEYASELEHLHVYLAEYAERHGGQYPPDLTVLRTYFAEDQWPWPKEHVVYIGAGKSSVQAETVPLAYEKTLLPFGFGTYVLYGNRRVEFEVPAKLKELGIPVGNRTDAADASQDTGEASPPGRGLAWQRTDRYVPPDPNGYFPDDPEAGKKLDVLFRAGDRDGRSDEEILSTARRGFRRTVHSHNSVLQWIGGRFIWGKRPQNPQAIELMYHAVPLERHYAVYSGLSVVKDKSPNILRTLAEICMQGEEVGRIAWGIGAQREQLLAYVTPYLQDKDPAQQEMAAALVQHLQGEMDFESWLPGYRVRQGQVKFGPQLAQFKETLQTGDSEARYQTLTTIVHNQKWIEILDDSFLPVLQTVSADPDPRVRTMAANAVGYRWLWLPATLPQDPAVIELMLKLSSDSDREVKYNAVYYGLSAVRDKSEPVVRRLVRLAMVDQEADFFGRISWTLRNSAQKDRQGIERVLEEELKTAGTGPEQAAVRRLYKEALDQEPRAVRALSGEVVDPNGAPAAGAQVALITAKVAVTIRDGWLEPPQFGREEKAQVIETDVQGRFRFETEPNEPFSVVAAHKAGFAIATAESFQANGIIRLEPWGRIEGQVAEGREAVEGKIWMNGLPNETWRQYKRDYRYETTCDGAGRFTFEKVPSGRFEVGYLVRTGDFSSSLTSRTPVVVKAGETAKVKLGGEGRPVVGRFVPPEDYNGPVYFGAGLRALQTRRPDPPRPPDYDQMTKRQQQEWTTKWWASPEARALSQTMWSNPRWRAYTFRVNSDGSFRIEDVIAGQYTMMVFLEEAFSQENVPSEFGSYSGTIEVPEMPGGRSDEPLDLGDLTPIMRKPLHVGDAAPPFEARSVDGNDVRLIDYRGRFVLLSFWSPVFDPERDRLRELHETYGGTGQLAIIGFAVGDTLQEVRNYLDEHKAEWPEIYPGEDQDNDIAKRYGNPVASYILLVDPEGKIIATWLRDEKLTEAVREAMEKAERAD